MGLDMYLHKCNRTEHTVEQLMVISDLYPLTPKTPEAAPFLPLRKYEWINAYSIFHEAGYWRKANAIHGWFVENAQNGVDDCGYYELTKELLEKMLEAVQTALRDKNPNAFVPRAGFFFGSTAIDEWYWNDLKSTVKILKEVLADDWSKYRFFYHSSW